MTFGQQQAFALEQAERGADGVLGNIEFPRQAENSRQLGAP